MKNELMGLVLTGGSSSRMRSDKALLKWRGQMLFERIYELIKPFCSKVFLACGRVHLDEMKGYPVIYDQHGSVGPLDGILSAMESIPGSAWLVAAVDLPLVESDLINSLVEQRVKDADLTLFRTTDGKMQPLLAIYEPSVASILRKTLDSGSSSLLLALRKAKSWIAEHPEKDRQLYNMNYPEDFLDIQNLQ